MIELFYIGSYGLDIIIININFIYLLCLIILFCLHGMVGYKGEYITKISLEICKNMSKMVNIFHF